MEKIPPKFSSELNKLKLVLGKRSKQTYPPQGTNEVTKTMFLNKNHHHKKKYHVTDQQISELYLVSQKNKLNHFFFNP